MTTDLPHTTLAVACRNTRPLTLALTRLLRHLYPAVPIIVHDDASADGTFAFLSRAVRKDPNLRVLGHPGKRIGHGPSMNALMEAALTPYVLLLDSDTIVTSDELVPWLVEIMDRNPEAYGCGRVLLTLPNCGSVIYLAPWFAMIRRGAWEQWPKFTHGLAPFQRTMEAIAAAGKSGELLLDAEGLTPEAARKRPVRNVLTWHGHTLAFHAEQVTCAQEGVAW